MNWWLSGCLVALLSVQGIYPLSVERIATAEGERFSVHGNNVPVDRLVQALAEPTGRAVLGFEGVSRAALVQVSMTERTLEEILEVALGSVGLYAEVSHDWIRVQHERLEGRSTADLRDLATAAYLSNLQRFPSHPTGAQARLGQARVEVARDNHSAALDHLRALVDTYRTSPLVHEARLLSAASLELLGRYGEASAELRAVASAEAAAPWHAEARLHLARNTLRLGNAELAEAMVNTLAKTHPSNDRGILAARDLLRAECALALARWVDALHAVEVSASRGMPVSLEMAAMTIRARAFEGLDLLPEAARAWLIVGSLGPDVGRESALQRSAEISLEAREELSVLFVAKAAEEHGLQESLQPLVLEARRRLGLPSDPSDLSISLLLAHCEELERAQRFQEMTPLLARLHAARTQMGLADFHRTAFLRARQAYALAGIQSALDILRDARWEQEQQDQRKPLDFLAADLLERERDFERALLAYEGVY